MSAADELVALDAFLREKKAEYGSPRPVRALTANEVLALAADLAEDTRLRGVLAWPARADAVLDAVFADAVERPFAEAYLGAFLSSGLVRTGDVLARALETGHTMLALCAASMAIVTGDLVVRVAGVAGALDWLADNAELVVLGDMTGDLWRALWRADAAALFRSYPLSERERIGCALLADGGHFAYYEMYTNPKKSLRLLAAMLELPAVARAMAQHALSGFKGGDAMFSLFITADIVHARDFSPAWAAEEGRMGTLEWTLSAPENRTSARLQAALSAGVRHLAIVHRLVTRYGADPTFNENELLRIAACYGVMGVVRFLLTRPGVDARARDSAALTWVARHGNVDLVEVLLAAGAVPSDEALAYATTYAGSLSMGATKRVYYGTIVGMLRETRGLGGGAGGSSGSSGGGSSSSSGSSGSSSSSSRGENPSKRARSL